MVRSFVDAERVALPTGIVVPDLKVKHSQVLMSWKTKRQAERGEVVQRQRLQQQARAYEGAAAGRFTSDWWAQGTSSDSELLTSLRMLRNRSRQLVRDNPYARHSVRLLVNNTVGTGVGLQAQVVNARGKLQTAINDGIEAAWTKWSAANTCHTAGLLPFSQLERLVMSQLVTTGEAIVRIIRAPFGGGRVPLALEVIESDRLLDQWQTARAPNGNAIRLGVEVDDWGRPTAYWFNPKHPGDYQFATFTPAKFVRVPAADIIHLYVMDRWPQTRGEPWFSSTLRNLHDIGGYESATIIKARSSANIVGFIKSPEPMGGDALDSGRRLLDTEPGTWQTLLPGEDIAGFVNPTPSPELQPFLQHMIRKHAVGVGLSYEAASRDYSNATYSSARMGLLDDRDQYRVIQGFFVTQFRQRIHREFIDAANLVGEIKTGADYYTTPEKYQAARFKTRGWSWIDPAKEVAAYKAAVRNGFMTQGDVIAATSPDQDIEDLMKSRREELDMAAELDLVFDTDPGQVNDKGQAQPLPIDPDGNPASAESVDGSADATNDPSGDGSANDSRDAQAGQ